MTTVAIMAGGTGGHVFPALAVAARLRAHGAVPFWLGTRAGLEARLVPEHGCDIEWLDISGVRGKRLSAQLAAPWRLARAWRQAHAILRRRAPAVVLGMGGFVAAPGGLAAWLQGRPLIIHEQNSVPGLTNRLLAPLATRVLAAFPDSFPARQRVETVGNPVRAEILALPAPRERWAGRTGPARLLVLGGSLGAQVLNQTVPAALARLPAALRPQVRHQAGERTLAIARAAYQAAGVAADIVPFITDMAAAYGWADLVIARAGALTIAELAAAGLPALLVPYPHAVDDHQTGNARYLTAAGAARLLPQAILTPEYLAAELETLLRAPARRLALAEAARACAWPDAAERIAAVCLEWASSPAPRVRNAYPAGSSTES